MTCVCWKTWIHGTLLNSSGALTYTTKNDNLSFHHRIFSKKMGIHILLAILLLFTLSNRTMLFHNNESRERFKFLTFKISVGSATHQKNALKNFIIQYIYYLPPETVGKLIFFAFRRSVPVLLTIWNCQSRILDQKVDLNDE